MWLGAYAEFFLFLYIAVWVSHLLSYTRVFLVAVIFSLSHVPTDSFSVNNCSDWGYQRSRGGMGGWVD